jgi:glycosyltransferase involved in cell wall biosynthesis
MPSLAVDARMIRHSGIGTYLQRLLPRVMDEMPDVRFLLLGDEGLLAPYRDRAEIIPCQAGIYSLRQHREIPGLLRGKASALWTPHFNVPARGSLRIVATIHDVIFLARPEFFGRLRPLIARRMIGTAVRRAERILTVSQFTLQELIRFFPGAASRAVVARNFIEEDYAQYQPQPVPYEKPYLLTVGLVKPHKNISTLLSAFELIKDELDVDLVIVGKSEGLITGDPKVRAQLERAGSRVHFTEYVETDLLKSLYARAACAVFPSFYEGFGLGPLEAMALGCPVVASDIPAVREVCGDAVPLFDPSSPEALADRLRALLPNPELRNQIREAGLQRAQLFGPEEPVRRTVEALRGILG